MFINWLISTDGCPSESVHFSFKYMRFRSGGYIISTYHQWIAKDLREIAQFQVGYSNQRRNCTTSARPPNWGWAAKSANAKQEHRHSTTTALLCARLCWSVPGAPNGQAAEATLGHQMAVPCWSTVGPTNLGSSPLKFPASSPIRAASWFENPHPHGQPANRLSNTQHASEKPLRMRTVLLRQIWLKLEPVLFTMAVT